MLALAVGGSTVYAGGSFTSIGGQAGNHIAALDATTGNATAWNPNASRNVYALAVSGTTVYAGGYFLSIGGQARMCIAALDIAKRSFAARRRARHGDGRLQQPGVAHASGAAILRELLLVDEEHVLDVEEASESAVPMCFPTSPATGCSRCRRSIFSLYS